MLEWWKPVVGYEGLYEVSSQGRVRRIGGKVLKPATKRYVTVNLCRDGKYKTRYVHQLVIDAFRSGRQGLEVNHKDENKLNPALDNLEVLTHAGNARHSALLTVEQVLYIREHYKPRHVTRMQLAAKFGVTLSCIKSVLNYKNWRLKDPA